MKKSTPIVLLLVAVVVVFGVFIFLTKNHHGKKFQIGTNKDVIDTTLYQYGTWGNGASKDSVLNPIVSAITGYNLTVVWSKLEPKKDTFDWDAFDAQVKALIDKDLSVGIEVWVGGDSPAWIYCDSVKTTTCVSKVYTNDSSHKWPYYPYYMDSYYQERYKNMLSKVAEHISTYSDEWKKKLVYWESAEGSTGDEGPYKGTPKETQYVISDEAWSDYKKSIWLFLQDKINEYRLPLKLLINQANTGEYFDYILETPELSCAWFKAGDVSHDYSFNGELNYYNRLATLDDKSTGCNRTRGELEQTYELPSWKKAPLANTYMLTLSALTLGLDILNIRGQSVDLNTPDLSVYTTFTKFAGIRKATDTNKAFVYFRDVIDLADTKRFPENVYGALYSNPTVFQNALSKIMKDTTGGAAYKATKITNQKIVSLNPARISAITQSFSGRKNAPIYVDIRARAERGASIYEQDYGVDMLPDNYGLFIKQIDPNGTSIGQWRVGTVNSKYGRYARSFDNANGKKEIILDVDDTLNHSVRNTTTNISVTYFDTGTSEWSLNYATGRGTLGSVTIKNSNTNVWKTYTTKISDMNLSNKIHGGDLSLSYVNGGDTIFAMVEIETQ